MSDTAFKLSSYSLAMMTGVDERLVKTVKRAIEITEVDFRVVEGLRTLERQKRLFAEGRSQTLKSKHLVGLAVDLVAIVDGRITWEWRPYEVLAEAMKRAAKDVGVTDLVWGGDWKTFKDGPHFQLGT